MLFFTFFEKNTRQDRVKSYQCVLFKRISVQSSVHVSAQDRKSIREYKPFGILGSNVDKFDHRYVLTRFWLVISNSKDKISLKKIIIITKKNKNNFNLNLKNKPFGIFGSNVDKFDHRLNWHFFHTDVIKKEKKICSGRFDGKFFTG